MRSIMKWSLGLLLGLAILVVLLAILTTLFPQVWLPYVNWGPL